MAKKKKQSAAQLHRQVKDSLQALPYVVEQERKQGHPVKAFMLRYVSAPMLSLMNRFLNRRRYKGPEGEKLRQTDQMKRHLDQRKQAMRHIQSHVQQEQRRRRPTQ